MWAATKNPLAIPAAYTTGVLIDVDHAIDYFNWYVLKNDRRALIIFHAWEFSLIGLVALFAFWQHPIFIAAVLGHVAHITADQIANKLHPMAYLITYRISHKFDRRHLIGDRPIWSFSQVLHANIPLWGTFEPFVLKVLSRLRR